jgi:hypothetical protein
MKTVNVSAESLQVGAMMVRDGLLPPKLPGMETEACLLRWLSVKTLNSFMLSRKLETVGLHLFFVVGSVTSFAFGIDGGRRLHKTVQRIAAKVMALGFNCLELTEIHRKHFLGVPYITISARTYHIQQGWQLKNMEERRALAPLLTSNSVTAIAERKNANNKKEARESGVKGTGLGWVEP